VKRALAISVVLPAAQALACAPALRGDGVRTLEGQRYVVAWRGPAPLPLAEFFALDFAVCARDGRTVASPRVDATMPAHGHGMNYRPSITALGDGRFRADGLLLHMPGQWQLTFDVGGGETFGDTLVVD
jgi:hypothetical protein